jgi:diguanylate cyclase (GGDEF)-like protein
LTDHAEANPPLAMMLLDLDHFKRINDEHGHLRGDKILQDAADLLKATVRQGDVLARYGGEEFVVLLPRTTLQASCHLAERIRQRISERLGATVSIGVAASLSQETPTSLIARADAALYAAKQQGRDRTALHEGPNGRVSMVRDLTTRPEPASGAATLGLDRPTSDIPASDRPAVALFRGEAC